MSRAGVSDGVLMVGCTVGMEVMVKVEGSGLGGIANGSPNGASVDTKVSAGNSC